jgi:branched-chain amino acid transport system permease protein
MPGAAKFWIVRIASILAAFGFAFGMQSFGPMVLDDYAFRVVNVAGIFITLAVSLNLINGITGQFSIGHAAFYQVGAYLTGFWTTQALKDSGLPPLLWLIVMMLVGAAAAGLLGFIVGLPSLRLRGDYLAIVTLGFNEIVRIISTNIPEVGGAAGFNVQPKIVEPWLIWMLAIICIALSRNLLKNAHGLAFLAVREDEVASGAMGVNTTRIKVYAFIVGSALAGAAGVLYAHYDGFLEPKIFGMQQSFIILTMVVLGGTGSITGSALAAVFLTVLPEYLRDLKGAGGQELALNGGGVIGLFAASILMIMAVKWVKRRFPDKGTTRNAAELAAHLAPWALIPILNLALNFGFFAERSFKVSELRMALFAIVLVLVMQLRPSGVFGHHEFSWSWLRGVAGRIMKREAA